MFIMHNIHHAFYIINFLILGRPNITTNLETNIKSRSVELIGNIYFYDDSPGIIETYWKKNDEKINLEESSGKLLKMSSDISSLTIRNVNPGDAGKYQLTAINAVGSSTSDVIVLGTVLFDIFYLSKK